MATRRAFRGSRGRGFRPPTEWESVEIAANQAIPAATKVFLASFTVAGASITVRRTRGLVAWSSDQLAASETPVGAFGMMIVSDAAFAAGAASIPGPFTDAQSDLWFVHQYLYDKFILATAVGFNSGGQAASQYTIDSSAMRRQSEEERLVVMVENGHATQGASFWYGIRVLSSASRG